MWSYIIWLAMIVPSKAEETQPDYSYLPVIGWTLTFCVLCKIGYEAL